MIIQLGFGEIFVETPTGLNAIFHAHKRKHLITVKYHFVQICFFFSLENHKRFHFADDFCLEQERDEAASSQKTFERLVLQLFFVVMSFPRDFPWWKIFLGKLRLFISLQKWVSFSLISTSNLFVLDGFCPVCCITFWSLLVLAHV